MSNTRGKAEQKLTELGRLMNNISSSATPVELLKLHKTGVDARKLYFEYVSEDIENMMNEMESISRDADLLKIKIDVQQSQLLTFSKLEEMVNKMKKHGFDHLAEYALISTVNLPGDILKYAVRDYLTPQDIVKLTIVNRRMLLRYHASFFKGEDKQQASNDTEFNEENNSKSNKIVKR